MYTYVVMIGVTPCPPLVNTQEVDLVEKSILTPSGSGIESEPSRLESSALVMEPKVPCALASWNVTSPYWVNCMRLLFSSDQVIIVHHQFSEITDFVKCGSPLDSRVTLLDESTI